MEFHTRCYSGHRSHDHAGPSRRERWSRWDYTASRPERRERAALSASTRTDAATDGAGAGTNAGEKETLLTDHRSTELMTSRVILEVTGELPAAGSMTKEYAQR